MQGVPDGLNYSEFKKAVRDAIDELQRENGPSLGGVGSDGAESLATSAGMISIPRRRADWVVECIVTDRQIAGGGTLVDPATPGQDIQYKVRVLDTGVESGWISPVRGVDYATMGYALAAVGTHAVLYRFPDGTGAFDVHLVLMDAEKLAGLTCA